MAKIFTEKNIQMLIQEPKPLGADYQNRLVPKPKRGHSESELDIVGQDGSEFRIITRRSHFNPLDFSVILSYRRDNSNQLFRLKRYNGKSHEHGNVLEGEKKFYDFHIHTATERYQRFGKREDSYAEVTDRYSSVNEAIGCLLKDCAFLVPPLFRRKVIGL